jgi:UDP-2,3-diacylglucosamine pyrophosphatase LpxH
MGLKTPFSQGGNLLSLLLCLWKLDELSSPLMKTSSREISGNNKGYVVSDLHIFGCASLWKRYESNFYRSVAEHSTIVLNGDTFDFKRSRFSSSLETTTQAISWLKDLCHSNPSKKFFFLLGNHDSQRVFTAALIQVASAISNLRIEMDTLRLGSSIFLHGDAIDLPRSATDLTLVRERYYSCEPSVASRAFAEIVTRLRINFVEYLRHSKLSLANRISRYLNDTHPDLLIGAKEIFFGHTHVPFSDFEHHGLLFHNTGSLVRGLGWNPREFEL